MCRQQTASKHVVFIINVTLPPLTAIFSKKAPNPSCGQGAMLGAEHTKMTTMWPLTQDASCVVGGRPGTDHCSTKDEFDYRRTYNVGVVERAREAFSEEDLKAKLGGTEAEHRQRHPIRWEPWSKKWSEVVAMAAWQQGILW